MSHVPVVSAPLIAVAMIAAAGVGLAAQGPVNAALARLAGGPLTAAALSFGVGFLLLAVAALALGGVPDRAALAAGPWWIWIGGGFGAWFVFAMAAGVPTLGALTAVAALALGQVVGAIALDAVGAFGVAPRPVDGKRVLAALLVAAGVALSRA